MLGTLIMLEKKPTVDEDGGKQREMTNKNFPSAAHLITCLHTETPRNKHPLVDRQYGNESGPLTPKFAKRSDTC